VNCSAIPETLLESEIFGHEKGAFTGALERRAGCFELAHGGTLFLDEVAEMATGTQAKFLRILQDGMVRRLGGKVEFKVDVRVVAATNKDPTKALQDGQLREDLYYRLNVFSIRLPPLREHLEDIPLLAHAFVEEFGAKYDRRVRTLDDAALRLLSQQRWPGNVRELRNTIERAVIACDGDVLGSRHLPDGAGEATQALAAGAKAAVHGEELTIPLGTTVDDAEKALILATLGAAGNNKTKAAEVLKISLKTLHNKLRRYGL
jgi:transcriptional regulator with PAS, ATPase and Fis domain